MRINTHSLQQAIPWMVVLAALLAVGAWLAISPEGVLGKADALGYAVCHRLEERSFLLDDGRQLPLCARCSGMYLGAVIGLAYQAFASGRNGNLPGWKRAAPLLLFFALFAVDGSNSYLYMLKSIYPGGPFDQLQNIYTPNNTLRLFTGMGMGLGIAVALFPSYNQSVWADWQDKPALGSWKQVFTLVGLGLAACLLVLTEWDAVLLPAALISAGGVLAVLTLVYSMVWIMAMRQENTFTHWRQLWLPLLAGMTLALLQILVIDVARLWFTGTWGGFPLPGA